MLSMNDAAILHRTLPATVAAALEAFPSERASCDRLMSVAVMAASMVTDDNTRTIALGIISTTAQAILAELARAAENFSLLRAGLRDRSEYEGRMVDLEEREEARTALLALVETLKATR